MKRLNLEDPKVWDVWRSLYSELTQEENIQFGYDINAIYPHQQSFTVSNYDLLFSRFPGRTVMEIGGWKGELAHYCLTRYPIKQWTNFEICQAAVEKTVPMTALPFSVVMPNRFDWFKDKRPVDFDVCVAAHTIEHLSDEHLVDLVEHIKGTPIVMFEAPIQPAGDDWTGYQGTHILKMGWNGVNAAMRAAGYVPEQINQHCFLYQL